MSVSSLSEQLVKASHDVLVLTTTANGKEELSTEVNSPQVIDGVNVIYFDRATKDHTHFSPKLLSTLSKNAATFNVIHIHAWWNLVSVLSCVIALAKGVKVIVSPRGTLSNYSFTHKSGFLKSVFHQIIGRNLLRRCVIHATSDSEEQELTALIKPKQIFNIPNFIHLPLIEHQQAKNTGGEGIKLLFLSRIDEKKGLDILINALALVNIPWSLSIVGDGDLRYVESLKEMAVSKNIDQYISWLGFRQTDKFEIYRQHDLFVLPSHNENFGNVVIESLSVGTPVLLSKHVGLADYVSKENLGWVFDLNEVSLKDTIQLASSEKTKRDIIQKDAPILIRSHFSDMALIRRYEGMYQQITDTADTKPLKSYIRK
jgi:glycosyltransferase involved in cell wall biosynthesis